MASPPISDLRQCADWILAGARPRAQFKVGTEFERLLIGPDAAPLPWDGRPGIRQVIEALAADAPWQVIREGDRPIALARDGASITLEPAGQFELSGAPLASIDAMQAELDAHLREVDGVLDTLGARPLYVGLNPHTTIADAPRMPKDRYGIMRAWMPGVGGKGLQMMHLTCTVQANLDFTDGADAMSLVRAGFLATPVLIALFANSPWRFGQDTGLASARADLWLDVDPARCELGALAFDPAATVDDYVAWAAQVPMYFVLHAQEDGAKAYLAPEREGATFADLLAHGDRGRGATEDDWALHLSTLFPDVRLKRYVELRGADCVPPDLLPALPALAIGLLEDLESRAALMDLMRDGDASVDRAALRAAACRDGLDGRAEGFALREVAERCLALADAGLARVAERRGGRDEAGHAALARLAEVVSGRREAPWRALKRRLDAGATLGDLAADPAG